MLVEKVLAELVICVSEPRVVSLRTGENISGYLRHFQNKGKGIHLLVAENLLYKRTLFF